MHVEILGDDFSGRIFADGRMVGNVVCTDPDAMAALKAVFKPDLKMGPATGLMHNNDPFRTKDVSSQKIPVGPTAGRAILGAIGAVGAIRQGGTGC